MFQSGIYLPDIDENTGHVLVHYLYTGAYQTLDNTKTSPDKEASVEFKRAFLAYAVAKTYELAGLQQLAMHKIEHHGAGMTIFDVIQALNEDFSTLQGRIDWFQHYLNEKVKVAFEEDYTIFANNDFFSRVSNEALNKFLVQCVMELYNNKISRMLNTEECIQGFSEKHVPATQDSPVEETSAEVSVPIEEVTVENCPIHEDPTQECSVPDCSIEGPPAEEAPVQEALIEENVAAEPEIDMSCDDAGGSKPPGFICDGPDRWTSSWGPKTSWEFDVGLSGAKVKDEGKDNNFWGSFANKNSGLPFNSDAGNAVFIERAPAKEHPPPEGGGLGFVSSKLKKKKKKSVSAIIDESILEPVAEHENPEDKDLWSFSFGNAKDKETEKNGAALIEDAFVNPKPAFEPVLELEPEAPKEDDVWGFGLSSTGKKKKGKKCAIGESAAVIEGTFVKTDFTFEPALGLESETTKEDDAWGFGSISTGKKKKSKKAAIGESAALELEPETTKEDDVWWSSSISTGKKKKSKKVAIGENAAVIEDASSKPEFISEPVIELQPDVTKEGDTGGFGSVSIGKKKKSKKNGTEESAAVIEDTSAKPELASAPVIEREPEAAKEDSVQGWGLGKKEKKKVSKGSKGGIKIVEQAPNIEELAAPPLEPPSLADDGWGSLTLLSKKKKGKKSAGQETLVPEPAPSHSEHELGTELGPEEMKDSLWGDLGTTAIKKNKKGKKDKEALKAVAAPAGGEMDDSEWRPRNVEVIYESNISTASTHAEQAEDVTLGALKQTEEVETGVVSNGDPGLNAKKPEQPPEKIEEGMLCPVRAKHLLEGDMWKTCKQCRAVLRQVAIQLASTSTSTGHADEDGYEMVDQVLIG